MKKTILAIILTIIFGLQTNANNVEVDVHLSIFNSFSGTVNITGTNSTIKNNIIYTATKNPTIEIYSDSASSYIITGDLVEIISGDQSQPYILQTAINLDKTNSINAIFPMFRKGLEPLVHKKINIFFDNLGPSIPTIISPIENTKLNGPTIISRSISTDLGVGLKEYILLISTDQNFSTTILYQPTTNNEYYIDTNNLNSGKLYIKILAKDELANISESQTISVCNKCSSTTNGGGGGGGNTYTPPSQITDIQWITIIEDLEEKQKITKKEEPEIGLIGNILYEEELLDAYKYAYSLGITTMPTAYQASLKGKLIRKDLAKMISEYAIKVAKKIPDNRLICNFDDIENESLETKYYTKLACKLGLMGRHADGIEKQDTFYPYEEVTRAQFGTVLSRTIFGETNNIQTGESYQRYQKHLLALNKNKIMQKIDTPQSQELRGRVMLTMMRADPILQIQHASAK